MTCDIEIKGYRCFAPSSPLRLILDDGIVSFVGPNNSGKSTALRFFYEFRGLLQKLTTTQFWEQALQGSHISCGVADTIRDKTSVFTDKYEGPIVITVSIACEQPSEFNTSTVSCIRVQYDREQRVTMQVIDNGFRKHEISHPTHRWVTENESLLHYHNRAYFLDITPWQTAIGPLVSSCYMPAFRNIHNAVLENGHYYDLHVGKQFIQQWREWRTGDSTAHFDLLRKVEEDIKRLMGFKELSIESTKNDDDLWLIIDGRRKRLSEVGSGVSQFVIAFSNVAIRRPALILIDEPELNLHPSLQVDFIQSLAKYGPSRIMIATHSIGLARSISKRVYCTTKAADGATRAEEYASQSRLPEFLGLMQYSGYAALGFTHILLVEGPTEVLIFHEWLRLYGIDHKVIVIPLGGSGMISSNREQEMVEVLRITSKVFALVDSERKSRKDCAPEREAFVDMCKRIGIEARATSRRCIERYFTQDAIAAAFPDHKYAALPEYDDAKLPWNKNDNWRIASRMSLEDLAKTDVGEFLAELATSVKSP